MMEVVESLDENGKPLFTVTSKKHNEPIYVRKAQDGFSFYEVAFGKGSAPVQLQGRYLTFNSALTAVADYIKHARVSTSKRRKDTYEENHPNVADAKSDNT